MRRLISLSAFALLISVTVWAQRGGHSGGRAGVSGGHGGGFAGHSGGSFRGGHFSGGTRGGFSHPGGRGFANPSRSGFYGGSSFHRGHHGRHFQTFGFRNNCYGWGCGWGGYPWWGAANYYPWWWDEQDRRFDDDYYRQYEIANEMNEQSLEQQRMLRQEEADGDADVYAPRRPVRVGADPPAGASEGDPIVSSTVLIFRDQRRQEVRNYAIVGNTLWNFSPQHTEKIPLADLDVAATEKTNEDRGVTFRVPGTNTGG